MADYHKMTAEQAIKELGSSDKGLSSKEAAIRLAKYGPNELRQKKGPGSLSIFAAQFRSPLIIILIIAAAISYFLESMLDAVVIILIVILNSILGFVQEYRAEKAMEALKRLVSSRCVAIRDGKSMDIDASMLVPGDIATIEQGQKVPADMRLLEVSSLEVNEAALTGESMPVKKMTGICEGKALADRKNLAYMGTVVTYGRAKALVLETGMGTEMGKIAQMIQVEETPQTPLQKRLANFGRKIGILVIAITALVFAIGLFRGEPAVGMFMTSVALAVAAVPEGLPAVVTITLAFGLKRMAKKNAIVRKLPAVETLGSVSTICSDKTGTLTRNEMVVQKIWAEGRLIDVSGSGYEPKGSFSINGKAIDAARDKVLSLLLRVGALCNNAELNKNDGWNPVGDPTEVALIVSAGKAFGLEWKDVFARKAEIPFTSERKMMATVNNYERGMMLCVKGAPEVVLARCRRIARGGVLTMSQKERDAILRANREMAGSALRMLAFAYKELKSAEKVDAEKNPDKLESDLIFLGLQGMMDMPREGVADDIALCRKAGIRTIMITGDNSMTALAVAKMLGIVPQHDMLLSQDDSDRHLHQKMKSLQHNISQLKLQDIDASGGVMEGAELDSMTDEQLAEAAIKTNVYARVNPAHKVKILKALRANGETVAMTGDGVNDAPAIKMADIGIAMGIIGTDVAKEASQMVLKDDNFSTIVEAVRGGRTIYTNISKFIDYLLSSNMGEVMLIAAAILIGFYVPGSAAVVIPLTAVQLLWMNLITDGLPALALGYDPMEPDIMEKPPRSRDESLMGRRTLATITLLGAVIAIGTLWVFSSELQYGAMKAQTMAFTTIVMFEMFNAFNFRSIEKSLFKAGVFRNRWLWAAVGSSIVLQLAVIYVPFLQPAFGTMALGALDWLKVIGVSCLIFVAVELKKLVKARVKK